ncbi:MAG: PAS domain S-box protein [Proteobacteria bacterium]|nr:PAS domain S-box protein [Pseudomonadota bacterium]
MSLLKDAPVRKKLIIVIFLIVGITALFSSIFMIGSRIYIQRFITLKEITIQAQGMGMTCSTPLIFNDHKTAKEILLTFRMNPKIIYAAIYDRQNKVFVSFIREDFQKKDIEPPRSFKDGYHFAIDHLAFTHQILVGAEHVGTVYMIYSLKTVYFNILLDIAILSIVSIMTIVFALLFFSKLQHMIAKPIIDLSNLMHSISKDKNYSLRALVQNKDEIGVLAAGFNEMLTEIQRRDNELEKYSQYLEEEVAKRTGALSHLNEKMAVELAERKKTEEMLLQTQFVVDHASDNIFWVGPDGQFVYVNEASCRSLGYSREELLAMHVNDLDNYLSAQEKKNAWKTAKKLGTVTFETRQRSKDGRVFPVEILGNYLNFKEKEYFVFFARDITERKQAAKALSEEKERLAITLQSIVDGVISTDTEGKIMFINKVAEDLTGWSQEEAVGRKLHEVLHVVNEKTGERMENPAEKVLRIGRIVGFSDSIKLISRDDRETVITGSGAPIMGQNQEIYGAVFVLLDITEKRKAEKELLKMNKIESVGVLAGGIAHDFNNILAAILGNISIAKMFTKPEDDKVHEKLSDAEKAIFRAKDLTQQLLTFSKGGSPIKKTLSIGAILKDSARFALTGSPVRCEFDLAENLYPVDIDEGLMHQVINNIVINAEQAMPQGGIIFIRAMNIVLKDGSAVSGILLEKGKYIKIAIEDRGIGIHKEYLDKIFDPYFTTKQRGSGIGLATTYSIIKKHEGYITVDSTPGMGTTFYIYLKASKKKAEAPAKDREKPIRGKGRVLLMDDEEIVANTICEILIALGYDVESVRDGKDAIGQYRTAMVSGKPFDVVILDLTVPGGMGGEETVKKLIEIDPCVKAIVSSGYSNDPIMGKFKEYGFSGIVPKPFQIHELSNVINKVMEEKK